MEAMVLFKKRQICVRHKVALALWLVYLRALCLRVNSLYVIERDLPATVHLLHGETSHESLNIYFVSPLLWLASSDLSYRLGSVKVDFGV